MVGIGGLGAEGFEGFALPHGLPQIALCLGFRRPAELKDLDGVAENPGQNLAVGCRAAELVDRPRRTIVRMEACIESGGRVADLGFLELSGLDGSAQGLLRDLDRSVSKLENRSELETERRTGHWENRRGWGGQRRF